MQKNEAHANPLPEEGDSLRQGGDAGTQNGNDAGTQNGNDGLHLPDERVIMDTKPCLASFFPFYLPSLYTALVVVSFLIQRGSIIRGIPETFRTETGVVSLYFLLGTALLVPAVVYSFAKLNLRYVIMTILGLAVAVSIKHTALHQPWKFEGDSTWLLDNAELIILLSFACVSLVLSELNRRSHRYLITEARIHTSAGVFSKRERILVLSKINDLSVCRGVVGGIFGFSTIVPVTASGMGMGADFAALAGSASKKWLGLPTLGLTLVGGHAIQIPKSRTHEALFGVRHADDIVREVMDILAKRELRQNA